MNPAIIAAIIGAVPAVIQGVQGAQQKAEGQNRLDNLERPTYEIPKEIQEMLNMARVAEADRYMPGEAQMRDQAALSAANQIQSAQQSGQASALTPVIGAGEQKAQQNISQMATQYQLNDMQKLTAALAQMASAKDTQYQINKFADFADRQAQAQDLIGAGNKNIFGGVSNIAALGASLAMNQSGANVNTGAVDPNAVQSINQTYGATAVGGAGGAPAITSSTPINPSTSLPIGVAAPAYDPNMGYLMNTQSAMQMGMQQAPNAMNILRQTGFSPIVLNTLDSYLKMYQ